MTTQALSQITPRITARTLLREWLEARVEGEDEVSLADILEEGQAAFRDNPLIVEDAVNRALRADLTTLFHDWARRTRKMMVGAEVATTPARFRASITPTTTTPTTTTPARSTRTSSPTAQEQPPATVEEPVRLSPFGRWVENGGAGQIRLKVMTRADLNAVIAERWRSTRTQLVHVRFLETIRDQLPEGVTVGDHFTDAQLATILARIESTTP